MKVELVKVTTEDSRVLNGAFLEPAQAKNDVPGVDVFLMMHGNGGNFYQDFYVEFAENFARMGCASVRANNRGHDVVNKVTDTFMFCGVAYERPHECLMDYGAWIDWLVEQGYKNIVLWGHSRGAVKTVYYQAHKNDPRLKACIVGSPPWLSYSRFIKSKQADKFLEYYRLAQKLVEEENPNGTFWTDLPTYYVAGAQCYLEKYGPDEKLNIFKYLEQVKGPVLALTGTEEVAHRFAFDELDKEFDKFAQRMPNLKHVSIPGAYHFYKDEKDFVFKAVLDWLRKI
ncbi:MAG: alpha/beta hydrolase [Terriglobia bacterium]